MTNSILVLKIIEAQGRLTLLRDRGLSHSQIALLIEKHQQDGNVTLNDDGIALTAKGKELLTDSLSQSNMTEKESWIVKQEHYYREPISTKTIVLPKKRKI